MKDAKGHGSDRLSYDNLKAFAWQNGFHAEVHARFDPALASCPEACWYLQPSIKQHPGPRVTLLKFSTAAQVYDYIVEFNKQESSQ